MRLGYEDCKTIRLVLLGTEIATALINGNLPAEPRHVDVPHVKHCLVLYLNSFHLYLPWSGSIEILIRFSFFFT